MFSKKLKALSATLVATATAATFVSCGVDPEQDATRSAAAQPAFTSVADVFAACSDYNEGSYSLSVDYVEPEKSNIVFTMNGLVDGNDFTIADITYRQDDTAYSVYNAVSSTNNTLYVNADSLFKVLDSQNSTNFGYYGLVLPDTKTSDEATKHVATFVSGMIADAISECDAEFDGRTMKLKLDTKDEFKSISVRCVNYISAHREEIESLYAELSGSVDAKEYLHKLIENIYPDLKGAFGVFADGDMSDFPVKEEFFEVIDDIEGEVGDLSEFFEAIESTKSEFAAKTEDEWDSEWANSDGTVIDLTVSEQDGTLTVNSDNHIVSTITYHDYENKQDDGFAEKTITKTCDVSVRFSFVKDDINITAPENVTTITDIATFYKENPDRLNSLSNGFYKLIGVPDMSQYASSTIDNGDMTIGLDPMDD